MADASDLRAHRALDDVLALRHVVTSVAQLIGVSVSDLLMRHAQEDHTHTVLMYGNLLISSLFWNSTRNIIGEEVDRIKLSLVK